MALLSGLKHPLKFVLDFSSTSVEPSPDLQSPTMESDIYISYDIIDSSKDINTNSIDPTKIPDSYMKFGYDKMSDPADIEEFLKTQGLNVTKRVNSNDGVHGMKNVASMIKRSKVFIACLSDR